MIVGNEMIILSSYVASASLLRALSGQESAFLTHQRITTTQHSASHTVEPQHLLCLGASVYVLKWRDQTKPFHFLFLVQGRKERKPLPPQWRLKSLRCLRAKPNIWYAPGYMQLGEGFIGPSPAGLWCGEGPSLLGFLFPPNALMSNYLWLWDSPPAKKGSRTPRVWAGPCPSQHACRDLITTWWQACHLPQETGPVARAQVSLQSLWPIHQLPSK